MKIWITGIAGTLGSTLASYLVDKGFTVAGNDIIRLREAWKIHDIQDRITYHWKSTIDMHENDLKDVDIVFDSGIGYADRPFGIKSPITNYMGNIMPSVVLSNILRRIDKPPTLIYPSSFNVYYGLQSNNGIREVTVSESSHITPSSEYGWSKASVELLYNSMHLEYNVPTIITTVGSEFGKKMRTDELVARLILDLIDVKKGIKKTIPLRSPESSRLWGYAMDIMPAYLKIIEHIQDYNGSRLFLAGNKGDKIVTNIELLKIISGLMDIEDYEVKFESYEPGEMINNKPISFKMDASLSRAILGWQPSYTLEQGLKEVIHYFRGQYE